MSLELFFSWAERGHVSNKTSPFLSLLIQNLPLFLRLSHDSVLKGPGQLSRRSWVRQASFRVHVVGTSAGWARSSQVEAVPDLSTGKVPCTFVTLKGNESPEIEDTLQGENMANVDFLFSTSISRSGVGSCWGLLE